MKLVLLLMIQLVLSNAFAGSDQLDRLNLESAVITAIQIEKAVFMADDVQILDSYFEAGKAFVTVGPESGGRAARIYHCWITHFSEDGKSIIGRTRLHGKSCREL